MTSFQIVLILEAMIFAIIVIYLINIVYDWLYEMDKRIIDQSYRDEKIQLIRWQEFNSRLFKLEMQMLKYSAKPNNKDEIIK